MISVASSEIQFQQFFLSSQSLKHNFGQKQKKIIQTFLQPEGSEIHNFREIILKLLLICKKSWTIILVLRPGMAPGSVTLSMFTGETIAQLLFILFICLFSAEMLMRVWSWSRLMEALGEWLSRETLWETRECSDSSCLLIKSMSCWPSDHRGETRVVLCVYKL